MNRSSNSSSTILYFLALGLLVVAALVVQSMPDIRIPLPSSASNASNAVGASADWYVEQVAPWPEFVLPVMDGPAGVGDPIYFEPHELPPPPNCQQLGIEECQWQARWVGGSGEDMIELELRSKDGRLVGRAQMLKIQTGEFPELEQLARVGYNEGWIARIEVVKAARGQGIGRTLWQGGDAVLKAVSGGGVLRIFSDQAGWGPALMRYVPEAAFVMKAVRLWAYIVE